MQESIIKQGSYLTDTGFRLTDGEWGVNCIFDYTLMKLTTTVYKYKRSTPFIIGLIVLATVLFFFFSSAMPPFMTVIGVAL
jgi:hypothetical protein